VLHIINYISRGWCILLLLFSFSGDKVDLAYRRYPHGIPLLLLSNILKRLRKDSQQPDVFEVLSLDFKHTDSLFYLDLWPFSSPFLIVSSPAYAIQACQQHDLPTPSFLESFFSPLTGRNNLFRRLHISLQKLKSTWISCTSMLGKAICFPWTK